MSEALLLTFQSQLSVVMETVLKSAMFEITRLVEDSFLEEVGHRKQEVELLRRRLHLSESKLREKEDQWEKVRNSHCPDCGRPGDSSPREEIQPADTSRGLDAFSLGLRLIDQTSDQPSLASDTWSSRQQLDAFKHPASQSEEMNGARRRTEMMRQESPAEIITTVSAAQPPLDVLHKLLGSSGVDSIVCKSKSDLSETDLTFDKETDSRMLHSPLAVEANGSLEASSPNTSVKSELKLDFLPVKEEDEMIPVWESVSKDDACDGEMADPSQEELRGACDQEEIQVETFPGLNSLDMPDATSYFTPYSVNTSVHRDNRAPHSLLCTAQLMLPSKPERSDSLVQPENGHSGPNGPEFSIHHRHNKKTVGHFSPSKCRAPAERFHHCTQCLRTFSKAGDLRAHMLLHKGKKPLNCSQCDQTFAYNFELKIHQQHHSGERPHICAHCGKAFARLSNFKQHQNIHTQEKIFSCSQCGTRFNRATNLRVHLRRHSHVGKTFSCLQCAESFLTFRQMKAHVVKIHQRGK